MVENDMLVQSVVEKSHTPPQLNPNHMEIKLNDEQQQAVQQIKSLGSYNPFLLTG